MNQYKSSRDSEVDFKQIVLSHLKKILDLSTSELRNKTHKTFSGTNIEVTENEDTRKSYIQSVENLAYILIPYFDKEINKKYEEYIKIIDGFDHEVKEKLSDDLRKLKKEVEDEERVELNFAIQMKLKYAKKLFRELNLLLKRNDYLKENVYTENMDDGKVVEE